MRISKHLILLVTMFCHAVIGLAQEKKSNFKSAVFSYDNAYVGQNANLTLHYSIAPTWVIYAGAKYLIVNKSKDNPNWHYYSYKQFRGRTIFQHVGAKIGIEKHFSIHKPILEFWAFYDLQFTRAYRRSFASVYGQQSAQLMPLLNGPYSAFENTIGLGLQYNINKRFSIRGQAGGGIYYSSDKSNNDWALCEIFAAGIAYHL